MPLSPGDTLGPYEILALAGKVGMGQVYRARETRLKREVALKVLPEASPAIRTAWPEGRLPGKNQNRNYAGGQHGQQQDQHAFRGRPHGVPADAGRRAHNLAG